MKASLCLFALICLLKSGTINAMNTGTAQLTGSKRPHSDISIPSEEDIKRRRLILILGTQPVKKTTSIRQRIELFTYFQEQ